MLVSIYSDPEFYKLYRSASSPVNFALFRRIFGLMEDVVATNMAIEYEHVLRPGLYTVNHPHSVKDVRDGLEYETEYNGFTRLAGRMVDTRIFTPYNDLRQSLGAIGMVGIAPHAASRIHSLWVMSSDEDQHWMLEHESGQAIATHEAEALEADLTQVLQS